MNAGRKPTVTNEEILQIFTETDDPVLTTEEVSNAIGIGHRGTLTRLEKLYQNGQLTRKQVGPGLVWWIPQSRK